MNNKLKALLEDITKKKKDGYDFEMKEIDTIAEAVRDSIMEHNTIEPTPIVKISETFDIPVFQTQYISKEHSGDIHIHDEKCDKVKEEKIILVDKNETLEQQRFVIAHELAHYLFDYIGSDYQINNKPYTCPYLKNNHEGEAEKRANRFAASLLMPKHIFIQAHNNAVDIDDRRIYVIKYLSRLFQVKEASIIKRIKEVTERIETY